MSKTFDIGISTAYGAAVRGGYAGTYEQFCADLARLADVLEEFLGFSVTIQTLAEGQQATASYENGVLSLGIPKGDTGNGIQSISLLSTVGLVKTYRITYTNGNHFDFPVADGNGIRNTTLNADYTLTITYTDGTTWTSGSIRGQVGATPHLTIGTVETLPPSQSASATITGTDENPVLNLSIPKGNTGEVSQAEFNALSGDVTDLSRHLNDKQDAPATAGTAGQVLGLDSQLNPVWIENGGGSSAWELCSHSTWTMEEGGTEKGNVVLGMTSCYIDEYEFMIVGYAKSSSSAARQITFLTVNQTEAVNPYVWGKTAPLTSAIYNFFATFATDNAILHGEIGVISSWGNWLVYNISCYTPTISMNYTKKPESGGVHLLRDYINLQLANMIDYDIYLYRRKK